MCMFICIILLLAICLRRSLSDQFTNDGRLMQVEYARRAADQGGTILAVKCSNGIVLFSRTSLGSNKLSRSSEFDIAKKLWILHDELAITGSGIAADVRHSTNFAFQLSQETLMTTNSKIPIQRLSAKIAKGFHQRTLVPWLRPLGCSILLMGSRQSLIRNSGSNLAMEDTNRCDKVHRSQKRKEFSLIEVDSFGNCYDCELTCIGMEINVFVFETSSTQIHLPFLSF
jgi:hypothetical protein